MNDLITVQRTYEVHLDTDTVSQSVFTKVYNTIFTSGLVAKMGVSGLSTLLALASYMDEKGECYPTQDQLAERLGVHRNTVRKYLQDLLDIRIDGNPIVVRDIVNKGQGKIFSYYRISPLSQLAKFDGSVQEVTKISADKETDVCSDKGTTECAEIIVTNNNTQLNKSAAPLKTLNSSSAIKYFQEIYREVYNVDYSVGNYGRDGQLMKKKLIEPFGEIAKEIIEYAVRNYDKEFKNSSFPRPTIGMFTWIPNQIVPLLTEQKEKEEIAKNNVVAESDAETLMLEKLNRLRGAASGN